MLVDVFGWVGLFTDDLCLLVVMIVLCLLLGVGVFLCCLLDLRILPT